MAEAEAKAEASPADRVLGISGVADRVVAWCAAPPGSSPSSLAWVAATCKSLYEAVDRGGDALCRPCVAAAYPSTRLVPRGAPFCAHAHAAARASPLPAFRPRLSDHELLLVEITHAACADAAFVGAVGASTAAAHEEMEEDANAYSDSDDWTEDDDGDYKTAYTLENRSRRAVFQHPWGLRATAWLLRSDGGTTVLMSDDLPEKYPTDGYIQAEWRGGREVVDEGGTVVALRLTPWLIDARRGYRPRPGDDDIGHVERFAITRLKVRWAAPGSDSEE